MTSQFLIGAASSGSGKTTFTMGLLRALKNRGCRLQPFKSGPDYIDPLFHTQASGQESVNLDVWMSSPNHVRTLYATYGAGTDVCVVEGVMGLFDGYARWEGSSGALAALLSIPVILLVNARSAAYSVAPLINGFAHFRSDVRVMGVVFNRVASPTHFQHLKEACDDIGVDCFGYLPQSPDIQVPSRHLGLSLEARQEREKQIALAADLIERHVDIDRLLAASHLPLPVCAPVPTVQGTLRVAVARDDAFNFIYHENLVQLHRLGEVNFFSPLRGDRLPSADLVYLPGGYPELFAPVLSARQDTLNDLKDYAEQGGRLLAECGGMMYLSQSITDADGGRSYPMAAVLPFDCTMAHARLHLGYRRLVIDGSEWRGHEFHYSDIVQPDALPSIAGQFNGKGVPVATSLYRIKNVIAGYTHLYWGDRNILELWN